MTDELESLLAEFRDIARERAHRITLAWLELEKDPTKENAAKDLFRELHTLKGEARMMGFTEIASLAHAAEDLLLAAKRRGFNVPSAFGSALLSASDQIVSMATKGASDPAGILGTIQHLRADLEGGAPESPPRALPISQGPAPTPPRPSAPTQQAETESEANAPELSLWGGPASLDEGSKEKRDSSQFVRVDGRELADVGESIDWLVTEQAGEISGLRAARALVNRLRAPQLSADDRRAIAGDVRAALDQLLEGAEERTDNVRRIADRMRRLRMVPVRELLARQVRAVRDLAVAQGKDVKTIIHDQGARIDRAALERLSEPMLHLVRNAVDHGLESSEERKAANKPSAGTLELRAEHSGSFVRLVVEDDGRGVDVAGVRNAAVRRGLIQDDAAQALSIEETLGLLFLPGFSTRDSTTEVSGRGLGLDIVKWETERLGGSVGISSTLGQGTRVELRVPLSTSSTRVVRFSVGDSSYALPATSVVEVLELRGLEPVESLGRQWVTIRAQPTPIVPIGRALFGVDRPDARGRIVLVVSYSGVRVALVVDEPPEEAEAVVRPLGDLMDSVHLVTGAGLFDRGEIALMLNPGELVSRAHGSRAAAAEPMARPAKRTILLVEDSTITRKMVAQILRSFGYEVYEAANGRDGLEAALHRTFDLILTDLDMPVMDGLEMISTLRADPRVGAAPPIVVLSTRGADDDKTRAAAAGADAYVVKTSFSEAQLRELIDRQIGLGA
ncbi:MAG: response regulator [Deltaproteobacteria bacterium]|nr:response regulator [Deltaproteobacteria bacterium]